MKKMLLAVLAISPLTTFAASSNQQVQIDVRLMEGDKLVKMEHVITKDGKLAPVEISSERSYIAKATKEGDKVVLTPSTVKSGIFLALTPTILKNGLINVAFSAKTSDINSIKTFKLDGMEVQAPEVTSSDLEGSIEVTDGKEVSIPFGPSKPGGLPVTTKYTLKLVVTKG